MYVCVCVHLQHHLTGAVSPIETPRFFPVVFPGASVGPRAAAQHHQGGAALGTCQRCHPGTAAMAPWHP